MNSQKKKLNIVFYASAVIIAGLVLAGAFMPTAFAEVANTALQFTTHNFGWLYLGAIFIFAVFLIYLIFSKYGSIRLGGKNERPKYPLFTWIGMLFSAGFGVALVFYGIGEPMSHFFAPPFSDVEAQSTEAGRIAMGYSFFHYGISQWTVFGIVGLAMAYFQFKKGKDGMVSTTLSPIIGKGKHEKPTKRLVDILAIVATVLGVATSIGLGVMQINGGVTSTFGLAESPWTLIIIMAILTGLYLLSATTGLDKGIRWLSNFNLGAALVFMLFVFVTGPTVFILDTLIVGIGDYITNFISYSLRLSPYSGGEWVYDWTVFYWAWAIAWAPFVGAFVARVSRGRTIREFILGVMVAPPAIALLWIAVFGGTALHMDLFEGGTIAAAVNNDITSALFATLAGLPFTEIVSVFVLLLIFTFLITSADSAVFILSSMSTGGSLNPPIRIRIIWGVLMSGISLILLLASGLTGLQTASIIAALPFVIILLLMNFSIFKVIRADYKKEAVAKNPAAEKKESREKTQKTSKLKEDSASVS
ncbi:BCCT family transporter [Bacillus mesophilum]|uniref:BCCT family transporter n=1 Tax=Bacillus mesophilum TaxID=1071718 RepID=A0A7V7RKU9_9BACI|nr:BCCT family transporter [Bacillus mesophilum]KAB2331996.1 BCCT family transporter [Bacillus mesophilum]